MKKKKTTDTRSVKLIKQNKINYYNISENRTHDKSNFKINKKNNLKINKKEEKRRSDKHLHTRAPSNKYQAIAQRLYSYTLKSTRTKY